MKDQRFELTRTTAASGDVLYALLADVPAWTIWAPLVSKAEFVTEGAADPTGAGAVRRVGGLGVVSVDEEILEAAVGRRQRYTVTRGLPVSSYDAEVLFEDLGDGTTRLVWRSSFSARPALLGPLLRVLLRAAIGRLADGLARAAEGASMTRPSGPA